MLRNDKKIIDAKVCFNRLHNFHEAYTFQQLLLFATVRLSDRHCSVEQTCTFQQLPFFATFRLSET